MEFKKITSKENPNIKQVKKLIRSAKFRHSNKEFAVEGRKLFLEAIENNIKIKKVFLTEGFFKKFKNEIFDALGLAGEIFFVSEELSKQISASEAPQGIVCVCAAREMGQNFSPEISLAVLENIQDPSNLGAILRTCEAFGIKNVVISSGSCDIYNPKLLRGSMGSIFRLEIKEENDIPEFIKKLNSANFKTCAMVVESDAISILDADFSGKTAIIIGNEGSGLTEKTINECRQKVTIPMGGKAESLNAAAASAVAIWEIFKSLRP